MAEAGLVALEDANISSRDVEMLFGGTMASGRFIGQEHVAALMADQLGLQEHTCGQDRECLRERRKRAQAGIHRRSKRHT